MAKTTKMLGHLKNELDEDDPSGGTLIISGSDSLWSNKQRVLRLVESSCVEDYVGAINDVETKKGVGIPLE